MILAQQSLPHTSWEFFGFALLLLASNLSAIMAWITSVRNNKLGKANAEKLEKVGVQIDGQQEKLLAVSKVADQAEGRQQERHHYETLEADAIISGKVIIQAAEVKALSLLEAAEIKAREMLKLAAVPSPEPPGEIGVRKVRES